MVLIAEKSVKKYKDSYENDLNTELSVFVEKANTEKGNHVIGIQIDIENVYNAHIGLSIEDAKRLWHELEEFLVEASKLEKTKV